MYLLLVLRVAHAWAQKIIVRQQNHCKSVTYLTVSLSYQNLGHRQTEITRHQRVGRTEPHRPTVTVLLEWRQRHTHLRSCWRQTF